MEESPPIVFVRSSEYRKLSSIRVCVKFKSVSFAKLKGVRFAKSSSSASRSSWSLSASLRFISSSYLIFPVLVFACDSLDLENQLSFNLSLWFLALLLPSPNDCEKPMWVASSSLSNWSLIPTLPLLWSSPILSLISFNNEVRLTGLWCDENRPSYFSNFAEASKAILSFESWSFSVPMFWASSSLRLWIWDSYDWLLLCIEVSKLSLCFWRSLFFSICKVAISRLSCFSVDSFSRCCLKILASASILWSLDLIEALSSFIFF